MSTEKKASVSVEISSDYLTFIDKQCKARNLTRQQWLDKMIADEMVRDEDDNIPILWLGRVLMKVRDLTELKDIVATVLVAGFELGWNSEIGPGADHIEELDAAIDKRLTEIRGLKR